MSRGGNTDAWFLQRHARQAQVADCSAGEKQRQFVGVEMSGCDQHKTRRRSPRDDVSMVKVAIARCSEILFTEVSRVLECDAVWFCKGLSMFGRNLL